jgi:hypothetical protein
LGGDTSEIDRFQLHVVMPHSAVEGRFVRDTSPYGDMGIIPILIKHIKTILFTFEFIFFKKR